MKGIRTRLPFKIFDVHICTKYEVLMFTNSDDDDNAKNANEANDANDDKIDNHDGICSFWYYRKTRCIPSKAHRPLLDRNRDTYNLILE